MCRQLKYDLGVSLEAKLSAAGHHHHGGIKTVNECHQHLGPFRRAFMLGPGGVRITVDSDPGRQASFLEKPEKDCQSHEALEASIPFIEQSWRAVLFWAIFPGTCWDCFPRYFRVGANSAVIISETPTNRRWTDVCASSGQSSTNRRTATALPRKQ